MVPESIAHIASAVAIFDRLANDERQRMFNARTRAAQINALKSEEGSLLRERELLAANVSRDVHEIHAPGGVDVPNPNVRADTVIERRPGTKLADADRRISAVRKQLAALEAEISREPVLTTPRIINELAAFSGTEFIEAARPRLPLAKAERPVDALPRFRDETSAFLEERRMIEKAPLDVQTVKHNTKRELAALRSAGVPLVHPLFRGAPLQLPRAKVPSTSPMVEHVPDGVALVAFLLGDQLEKKIMELIDFNAPAFASGLSGEERKAALAEVDSKLAGAWAIEAACVETVIAEGGTAFHRPNTPVLTALGIAVA